MKFGLLWPWAGAGEQRKNQVVPGGLWPSGFRWSSHSAGDGAGAHLAFGSLRYRQRFSGSQKNPILFAVT